ncbi:hypothetical protein ACA910_003023 [Epithemia clementina (nom. ined.)]
MGHMQHKEYDLAATCYTQALHLSSAGPQLHVYYSNRVTAFVSLRQFEHAILDSERALALQPNYSKVHARLGLAQILLGRYAAAKQLVGRGGNQEEAQPLVCCSCCNHRSGWISSRNHH